MGKRTDDAAAWQLGDVTLWCAALAGPAAAFAQVAFGLMLVPAARGAHDKAPLHAFTAALLATALAGLVYCLMRTGRDAHDGAGRRFVARGGAVLDAFSIVVIAAQAVPIWLLSLGD